MELEELKRAMQTYVGGEVEVQNSTEGYYYRGHIAEVQFVEAEGGYGPRFVATLTWQTYAPMSGILPSERLREVSEPERLTYKFNALLPFTDDTAPDGIAYKVRFQNIGPSEPGGGDRLHGQNPYTSEVATFFPPDGSKLDPEQVTWLPDGPYERSLRS